MEDKDDEEAGAKIFFPESAGAPLTGTVHTEIVPLESTWIVTADGNTVDDLTDIVNADAFGRQTAGTPAIVWKVIYQYEVSTGQVTNAADTLHLKFRCVDGDGKHWTTHLPLTEFQRYCASKWVTRIVLPEGWDQLIAEEAGGAPRGTDRRKIVRAKRSLANSGNVLGGRAVPAMVISDDGEAGDAQPDEEAGEQVFAIGSPTEDREGNSIVDTPAAAGAARDPPRDGSMRWCKDKAVPGENSDIAPLNDLIKNLEQQNKALRLRIAELEADELKRQYPNDECAHCQTAGAQNICTECRQVRYCDQTCQRADWKKKHRRSCRLLVSWTECGVIPLRAEITKLTKDKQIAEKDAKNLADQLDQLAKEHQEREEQIGRLADKNLRLEEGNEQWKRLHAKICQTKQELETEVLLRGPVAQVVESLIAQLEAKQREEAQEVSQVMAELIAAVQVLAEKDEEMQHYKSRCLTYGPMLRELSELWNADEAHQKYDDLKGRVAFHEARTRIQWDSIERLNTSIFRLEQDSAEKDRVNFQLQEALLKITEEAEACMADNATQANDIAAKDAEIHKLREANAKLKADNTKLEDLCAIKDAQIKEKNAALATEAEPGSFGLCVVCLDAPRSYSAEPCGHISMCEGCMDQVMASSQQCPACEKVIKKSHKVFLA